MKRPCLSFPHYLRGEIAAWSESVECGKATDRYSLDDIRRALAILNLESLPTETLLKRAAPPSAFCAGERHGTAGAFFWALSIPASEELGRPENSPRDPVHCTCHACTFRAPLLHDKH